MKQIVKCPQGHQWEVPHGDAVDSSGASRCPECGALADTGRIVLPQTWADTTPSSPLAAAPKQPTLVTCEILHELGRGGMGVVYKARQIGLDRIVALKMVLAGPGSEGQERERFQFEAAAVARLQHPNIVQIHEIGEAEGRPYFCLEFVDGGSLAQKIAGKPQPPRQAARLVQTLATAVQHAHDRDIVHRDLKPANVLLTSDGTPKIADFGLAKHLQEDMARTRTGAILGTPSYMAPEQAAGRTKEIGPATDIYALGAILYELLTGRPPFRGATVWATLEMVRSQSPPPPRRFQPKLPRDLQTLVLKCLEKEPGRRYATAAELADDLGRWLRGEPIQAQPPSLQYRIVRVARRHRAAAIGIAVALLALAGAGVGREIWLRRQTTELKSRVTQLRQDAYQMLATRQEVGAMGALNEALVRIEGAPRLADLRSDLRREIAVLQAPLAARERFARFNRAAALVFAQQPIARTASNARQQNGRLIALCEQALAEYGVLERDDWDSASEVSLLAPEEVAQLKDDVDALVTVYCDTQNTAKIIGAGATSLGLQLESGVESSRNVARVLIDVVPGGPAATAGIALDDKILEIDGVSTRSLANNDEVVSRLIGPPHSNVKLLVLPAKTSEVKEIPVRRSSKGTLGLGVARITQLAVTAVDPSSPAEKASIEPGDLLLSINGQPAEGAAPAINGRHETSPRAGLFRALDQAPPGEITLVILPKEGRLPRAVRLPWKTAEARACRRANLLFLASNMRGLRGAFELALSNQSSKLMQSLRIEKPEGKLEDHMVHYYVEEFLWPADFAAQAVAESTSRFPLFHEAMQLQARLGPDANRAAIASLQHQLQISPAHAPSWAVLGLCRVRLKQWDEAISTWSAHIALRPGLAIGYYYRGLAYREIGQPQPALRDFQRALDLNPEYAEAQKALDDLRKTAASSQ